MDTVKEIKLIENKKENAAEPIKTMQSMQIYEPDEDLIIMTGLKHSPVRHSSSKVDSVSPNNRKKLMIPDFMVSQYRRISEMHTELQEIVGKIEGKIDAVIVKEEKEFLAAYKSHLGKLQQELSSYRAKLDDKEFLLKKDNQVGNLEQNLEFFKHETMRLLDVGQGYKLEIEKLKSTIETLKNDNEFLNNQLKKAKKENKLLQINLRKTEQQLSNSMSISKNSINLQGNQKNELPQILQNDNKGRQPNYQAKFSEFIKSLKTFNCDKNLLLDYCQKYYQQLTTRFDEIESNLKQQLEHERKIANKLRNNQIEPLISRTELEQLFYECVEEVRRGTINRKIGYPKFIQQKEKANQTTFISTSGFENKSKVLKDLDKQKIIEKFMTNDKMLKLLYEAIFQKKDFKNRSDQNIVSELKENSEKPEILGLPNEKEKIRAKSKSREHKRSATTKTGSPKYCVRKGRLLIKNINDTLK